MKPRVALLVLISCFAAGVAQAQEKSCLRVEVSSGAKALTSSPHFSVTRILDLTFTVLFPAGMDGEHLVELRVFTPDDQLYRSLAVPVTSSKQTNLTRAVAGYPRPLPAQSLARVTRGRDAFTAATATFPVAGTDIVSSGLYGRWRVEAILDSAEKSCAPAATFTLKP